MENRIKWGELTPEMIRDLAMPIYGGGAQQVPKNPLKEIKTSELIHEMLRRGFAVMKLPESGTPDALT